MDNIDRTVTLGIAVIVLTLIILGYVGSCNKNKDSQYFNYKVVLIEKGGYSERDGKFSNNGKYFLVQSVADTTLYTELTGYNYNALAENNGSALYWSKQPGDTLFFKYIRKDRFWRKIAK